MKVIEFKMQPHQQAIEAWEYQLEALKTVWNSGLALLIESDARYWIERNKLKDVCPGAVLKRKGNKKVDDKPTQWRSVLTGVRRGSKDGKLYADHPSPIKERGERVGIIAGPYCAVRKLQGVNPLLGTKNVDDDGNEVTSELSKTSSLSHYPWMDKNLVCSRFLTGVHASLKVSWKAYKDGDRRRPKFKDGKKKLRSLTNGTGNVKLLHTGGYNGVAVFPKLPPVKVKGLFRRYHEGMKTGTKRVVKRGGEWYLQVSIKNSIIKKVKPSDKAVGIDPGVKVNIMTDSGKSFIHKKSQRLEERIRRLQKKASRQYLMNHDSKTTRPTSKGHARTQAEISRLKAKQARSRHAFQHKASTRIVSEFGVIGLEDTQAKNMTRRPKPKADGKGGYLPNGASAKSGLNKVILRSGIGGFKAKLKSKAKSSGRDLVLVPAAYTSATCSECGYQHTKEEKPKYRPNQATFICQGCGYTDNADVNAAKNIKAAALKILSETKEAN